MRSFLFGLLVGLLIAGGLLIGLPFVANPTVISRLPNTNFSSEAAGVGQNSSNSATVELRFPLVVALGDSGLGQATPTTDLTSLTPTISKIELLPSSFIDQKATLKPNQSELVNLKVPTVELMSLRGSGALAELGFADLAAGTYQTLTLTISSLRGRKGDGSIVELPIDETNQTVTLTLNQIWQPQTPTQLMIDIDTLASLSQSDTNYAFKPVIRRVLVNDVELNKF